MTRIATMLATALSSITLGTSAFVDPPKTLIWNASASAPIGLYAVRPANELDVTDLVAVAVPPLIAEFMADRGYQAEVKRLGIPDGVIEHGEQIELHRECGFDPDGIENVVTEMLVSVSRSL